MLAALHQTYETSDGVSGGLIALYVIVSLAIAVLIIASVWKTFTKANQSGWPAIIPILNYCVIARISGREWWWGLLTLIPCVGFVVTIILLIDLAKAFGHGVGFAIGLILLPFIFFPILGFGSSQYQLQTERWI